MQTPYSRSKTLLLLKPSTVAPAALPLTDAPVKEAVSEISRIRLSYKNNNSMACKVPTSNNNSCNLWDTLTSLLLTPPTLKELQTSPTELVCKTWSAVHAVLVLRNACVPTRHSQLLQPPQPWHPLSTKSKKKLLLSSTLKNLKSWEKT